MMSMRRLALVLLAALAACAHAPPPAPVEWPFPPDAPRIRFVRTLRNEADLDTAAFSEVMRTVRGGGGLSIIAPQGLALSEDGNRLYIAEVRVGRILVADFVERRLSRFAADDQIQLPSNIALDKDENVYVTDSFGPNVVVYSKSGKRLRVIGQDLVRPTGIALDKERGLVYVADTSQNVEQGHKVQVYTLDGRLVREIGRRGDAEGEFNFPTYLALDKVGRLYVADSANARVQIFDPEGRFLRTFGERGDEIGQFARLKGIALDGFGNVYTIEGEHSAVVIFSPYPDFNVLMAFGGKARKLEFMDIVGAIAIDPRTNLIYVGNNEYPRVNVYQLLGSTSPTPASSTPATPTSPASPAPAVPPKAADSGSAK